MHVHGTGIQPQMRRDEMRECLVPSGVDKARRTTSQDPEEALMSTAFPINPEAGLNDGNPEDDLMPETAPIDGANSEDTPDGASRAGTGDVAGANTEDLPYQWSELDETEAEG
jgi:hypothetical protein